MTNAAIIDTTRKACRQEFGWEVLPQECHIQALPNRNLAESDGSRYASPSLPPFEWYVYVASANKRPVRVKEVNAQTILAQVYD